MKLNPPYKHLIQKGPLCSVSVMQMVLFRRGHWFELEQLAKESGIIIQKEDARLFSTNLKVGPFKKVGLRFTKVAAIWNRFFKKHRLKLHATAYAYGAFDDAVKLVRHNIDKGNDVIVNFHWRVFELKNKWGHYVLVSEIVGKNLTVCDPSPRRPTYWKAPIGKFVKGMSQEVGRATRGFIVISHQ